MRLVIEAAQPAWTDKMMAISAMATALLTLLIAVLALWAWLTSEEALKASRAAADAAREANEQAKRDSIEQTRPYIFAEILPSLGSTMAYDIRIQNTGRSAARNLTLTLDAWPESLDDVAEATCRLLTTPRDLPPGSSIRSYWYIKARGQFTDGTTAAGMRPRGVLTAYYTSDDPSAPAYEDSYPFDVDTSGMWPTPARGPDPDGPGSFPRKCYRLARDIAWHIGELRR